MVSHLALLPLFLLRCVMFLPSAGALPEPVPGIGPAAPAVPAVPAAPAVPAVPAVPARLDGLPAGGVPAAGGTAYVLGHGARAFYVWAPPGYDPATAALVYYVHGYKRTADSSWIRGALPAQFRASGRNALFVAPEAPVDGRAPLTFARRGELDAAVAGAGFTLPQGPRIGVGHSGGYRLLEAWAGQAGLDALILLDALYAGDETFARFATRGRVVLVNRLTAPRAAAFARRFPDARRRAEVPAAAEDFTPEERAARVLSLDTRREHAALNDGGAVLPVVLALTI